MENQKTLLEVRHEQIELGKDSYGEMIPYTLGDISTGSVEGRYDYWPETLASYTTKEEALEDLKNYWSDCWKSGNIVYAEEYWVEQMLYNVDEDGELDLNQSEDICAVAPIGKQYCLEVGKPEDGKSYGTVNEWQRVDDNEYNMCKTIEDAIDIVDADYLKEQKKEGFLLRMVECNITGWRQVEATDTWKAVE